MQRFASFLRLSLRIDTLLVLAALLGATSAKDVPATELATTTIAAAPTPASGARIGGSVSGGQGQISVEAGTVAPAAVMLPIILIVGGEYSMLRVSPDTPPGTVKPREAGEALLAMVRLDLARQEFGGAGRATTTRIEAGYGPWALEARLTRLDTASAGGLRELREARALFRMAAGDQAELGLGYGRVQLAGDPAPGDTTKSGDSASLPLLIHPSPHWGIEIRPSLARVDGKTVRDREFAFVFGFPFASLRLGYRRFESGLDPAGERLSGAFAGVALRY